jgi:hypothetical protein
MTGEYVVLKKNRKYVDLLPKLQKRIVLSLAKNEPMTMSDTNRKISGYLSSTTRAFHELEEKGMVIGVEKKNYRGRNSSKFWLSDRGIAFALLNGANPNTLERIALNVREREEIVTYLKLRSLSPKISTIIDEAILFRGVIDVGELIKLLLPEVASLKKADFEKFFDAVRNSEFKPVLDDHLKRLRKLMNNLEKKE